MFCLHFSFPIGKRTYVISLISPSPFLMLIFSDDNTAGGCITNPDEIIYRNEFQEFVVWFSDNNLEHNVNKVKEIIVDFQIKKT